MVDLPRLDIEAIASRRKMEWQRLQRRKHFSLMKSIEQSVPWWLFIIAGVMFALSAPHTASVFNRLTPGWGWLAPLGVEFGLLYAAFRRKQVRIRKEKVPRPLWAFEILMFTTAIIVNGAGALAAVVSAGNIDTMSLDGIARGFTAMPITVQTSLLLVPFAAFIIPIGTGVTGEGLAQLILDRQKVDDQLDLAWRDVARAEIYQALFAEYTRRGLDALSAKREASALSAGYIGGRVTDTRPALSVSVRPDTPQVSAASLPAPVRSATADGTDKRTAVVRWLSDHPDEADAISVRKLAEATGASKTTAHEVLREYRANGRH